MAAMTKLLLLFLMGHVGSANGQECLPQNENLKRFVLQQFRGVSYYISNDIYTTDDAAAKMCETICGYLAEVNSLVERNRLVSLMGNDDIGFLIGGTDKYREGYWEYARNRKPVEYLQWFYNEPNDYDGNEDCMCLLKVSVGFLDCPCARRLWELKYVCEVD
ncbi:unnamed protein product [Lymnaea stagnalis]|uniref:C-type lectin domain-containing protein n=1 Tax=Lymnaea stagnalis TaxID=6523 RepID=A0AAV2HM15_LYMST